MLILPQSYTFLRLHNHQRDESTRRISEGDDTHKWRFSRTTHRSELVIDRFSQNDEVESETDCLLGVILSKLLCTMSLKTSKKVFHSIGMVSSRRLPSKLSERRFLGPGTNMVQVDGRGSRYHAMSYSPRLIFHLHIPCGSVRNELVPLTLHSSVC